MNNKEIAKVLGDIAELLELKGESYFRVRAYQKAATTVEQLPTQVETLWREGRLDEIPGVGETISHRIEEMLALGHSEYYDTLRAEFPPEFQSLLSVPGIGPKRIMRFHKELGVSSIVDLEAAARAGRIKALSGMGAKTEENILQAIEKMKSRGHRIPLGTAVSVVEHVLDWVRQNPAAHNLVAVGSYRRMSPTVGDLDIIATSDDPVSVMDTFAAIPDVQDVLAKGPTKTSLVVSNGVQVDLRIVPHESFGSLLQHFTGSKEHNIRLREFALSKGLSISEYGIRDLMSGEITPYETEEAVYARLGMDWIPPEMREALGEIEMALSHTLPRLVTQKQIRGDLHVHSNYSDGIHSIEEMARAAEALGYEYLAISDHSAGRGIANGLSIERLRQKKNELDDVQQRVPGIRLLMGSEVDIRADGLLDYPDEILAELDVVIGSVHSSMNQDSQTMTRRLIRAMQNPFVQIIGHPTGRVLGERDPYAVDMEAVLHAAAETGTAMEIDGVPGRLDLEGIYARRAKELGVKLVVSTDSHRTETLHRFMWFGIGQARRGWLEAGDLLNTLPAEQLLRSLHQKQKVLQAS